MIYKTFFGKYIDLDKLISVSDAEFIDRMGYGGYFVGFEMRFQLQDNPMCYQRELVAPEEYIFDHENSKFILVTNNGSLKCVENLQKQIDELIEAWKSFKSKNLVPNKE